MLWHSLLTDFSSPQVTVTDHADSFHQLTSACVVQITVDDVNDERPQFEPLPTLSVFENSPGIKILEAKKLNFDFRLKNYEWCFPNLLLSVKSICVTHNLDFSQHTNLDNSCFRSRQRKKCRTWISSRRFPDGEIQHRPYWRRPKVCRKLGQGEEVWVLVDHHGRWRWEPEAVVQGRCDGSSLGCQRQHTGILSEVLQVCQRKKKSFMNNHLN